MNDKIIISKELLSEVLSHYKEISNIKKYGNDITFSVGDRLIMSSINIHELAHKVKEWALGKGYTTASQITMCKTAVAWIMLDNGEELILEADTEPEAIFKAGEHILEELRRRTDER